MTQTRSFLFIAWLMVAGWLWLQWTEQNSPKAPVADRPAATATTPNAGPLEVEASTLPGTASTTSPTVGPLPSGPVVAGTPATPAAAGTPVVRLRNDVLELGIDATGTVVSSRLLGYTVEKKAGSPPVEILGVGPDKRYTASAGMIVADANHEPKVVLPTFAPVGGSDHSLPKNGNTMNVALDWNDPATGLRVRRMLTLERGSYLLKIEDSYANTGAVLRRVFPFVQLERTAPPPPPKFAGMTNPEAFSFVGAGWYTPEGKFDKTPFTDYDDETPPATETKDGWIGMLQHHFLAAWVPTPGEIQRVSTETVPGAVPLHRIRSTAANLDLAPGAKATRQSRLWVGPKLQGQLDAVAPGLKYSLDYGMFTFIAQPLFDYVLKPLHHYVTGNWGWAIILTVLLLKLALYPLSAAQFRSMAKLRAVQPRIEALKQRYGEDRQQFQMAMMELYKKEKINPVGGCLPLLIPLPIFFALYWVLLETVELRQAPWMGWIQNLTAPDPYFILPVLNLAVMYLTQRMTPTPGMDPMQKKMMQAMPIVFGVMMAFFPAGLVLYWVTNGLLGLLQQWWIGKQHGDKAAAPAVSR